MYRVITNATGPTYWLRGTTWTAESRRASTFTTEAEAAAALAKAKQFNPKAARVARIVSAEADTQTTAAP